MAHFTTVRSPVTNWANGTTVLPSELAQLDANQAGAINGDGGGVYAPSSAINIGGSGLQSTVALAILRGGAFKTGGANTIVLGDGDFPVLDVGHTGRSRTILHTCAFAKGFPSWLWRVRKEDAGLQALTPDWTTIANGQASPISGQAYVPIRAYDKATVASFVVYFRVGQPHANAPSTMPRVRMCRLDAGGIVTALTSVAAGADTNGYVAIPSPTSGAAWYAMGATQSITIACDQNNVVDVSQYSYHLEIVEENGIAGATFVLDRLASPSWQNKLLGAASLPTLWTGPVWQATHSFAAGSVIFPTLGLPGAGIYFINGGGTATSASTEPAWPTTIGATVTDGGITWTALASTQKFGNIWQAVAMNYTNITDTHWQ